jgi:hypothetical protein
MIGVQNYKIRIAELILDSYEHIPVAYITMHCMTSPQTDCCSPRRYRGLFYQSYEMNISSVKEAPRLFLTKYYPFNLKNQYTSHSRHYINVSTDRLGAVRGFLGIRRAHVGNRWFSLYKTEISWTFEERFSL